MTEASRVRTLIVDDEPLARERIRALLAREPDIEILGEASDGVSAVRKLVEQDFDLLFLDIQMPEMDGFDVLAALDELSREGRASIPALVFVTAHDRYALRAFDVHALDYLLKPFDRERFEKTLARARDANSERARQRSQPKTLRARFGYGCTKKIFRAVHGEVSRTHRLRSSRRSGLVRGRR